VFEADVHANFFEIVLRKGKVFTFIVTVERGQVRGGKWWLALGDNIDSGAYLVKGSVVMEVTESDLSMDIEVREVLDDWRFSDWIVIRCGFWRSYGLETVAG
jgi:hypothetical protein